MKTQITVSPNRDRGYDATVSLLIPVRLSAFARAHGFSPYEAEPMHTVNAPSEAKARELASAWLDSQPKQTRTKRSLSERDVETLDAQRTEERAHGGLSL